MFLSFYYDLLSIEITYKKGLLTKLPFDIKRNKIESDLSESFIPKGLEIQTFFSSIEHLSEFGLNSSIKIRLRDIQQPFISFLSAESSQ